MNEEFNDKRLLILGGSRISCEIVKRARNMGIITGVTDWYPLEYSPAKREADEAYDVSTSDIESMVKLVRDKKFDGVITGFTDSVLPYYAEICDVVGLPAYGTKEQFEIFTDKDKYKRLMRAFDIPTIPDYEVDINRFEETTADIEYPVIVKPLDGSGSRGVSICNNHDELRSAITIATDTSKVGGILVEHYYDNDEATIFWLFIDGKSHLMLLGNRHVKYNQEGELPLPAGYTYPSAVLPAFLKEVAPKMEAMFCSVGIRNGMMFMQCKVVNGTCFVYDIGYRLTGSLEYINLNALCGYNPLDMMIYFALTGKMGQPGISKRIDPYLGGKYAYNVSLLCKPGRIKEIKGLESIKKLPGVLDLVVAHPVCDVITEAMKLRLAQITVRILGKADTIAQMKDEMLEVQNLASVVSDTGEEMILSGLEESDYAGTIYEHQQ